MGPDDHLKRPGLETLAELAVSLGASAASLLPAGQVSAEDGLAALCRQTNCPNFGLSPTCPPNVQGPAWLRGYLQGIAWALFVKLDLPPEVMYSDQRREIGKLLHFVASEVEAAAIDMGFDKSMGLAGGSCKNIFCHGHPRCRVLFGDGRCRNPGSARPSISGYGINTNRLMRAAGWERPAAGWSTRCALVLVG